MWAQCLRLILVVVLYSLTAQAQNSIADETSALPFQPPWWSSFLDVRSMEPRKRQLEKFWATRGKRGDVYIKPNALFTPMYTKKNMKPNGFFMMGKRSVGLKPNGIFAKKSHWGSSAGLFGSHKRYIKPNGLFSITKRGGEDMEEWGGLFGSNKRYIKPNGLFSITKRAGEDVEDYDIVENFDGNLDIENDGLELMPSSKREDELFLPAKIEKGPEIFWATRG